MDGDLQGWILTRKVEGVGFTHNLSRFCRDYAVVDESDGEEGRKEEKVEEAEGGR